MSSTDKQYRAYVVAKCVSCGKTRKVYAGEIEKDDMPTCDDCYMPMVADRAGREKS